MLFWNRNFNACCFTTVSLWLHRVVWASVILSLFHVFYLHLSMILPVLNTMVSQGLLTPKVGWTFWVDFQFEMSDISNLTFSRRKPLNSGWMQKKVDAKNSLQSVKLCTSITVSNETFNQREKHSLSGGDLSQVLQLCWGKTSHSHLVAGSDKEGWSSWYYSAPRFGVNTAADGTWWQYKLPGFPPEWQPSENLSSSAVTAGSF